MRVHSLDGKDLAMTNGIEAKREKEYRGKLERRWVKCGSACLVAYVVAGITMGLVGY